MWKSWKFWAVWLSVAGFVALLAFGFTTDPKKVPSPLVGRFAPEFEVKALNGKGNLRLSDLKGKPVLLNFWASWCQECKIEAHVLEAFHQKYGAETKQIVLVGIAIQDTPEKAKAFALAFGKSYFLALDDQEGNIAMDYGIYGVPETYFIDPEGFIFYKHIGGVTSELLETQFKPFLK
ncbi:MAG: redoxin domain-containing protein [SAR324 cluster bacterium]|nr:redoxin domain-containing protein [SAR324 cluster bacterium]MBL7035034.1 redoxin domain-containing protein [SAR324 cluster bacterium]